MSVGPPRNWGNGGRKNKSPWGRAVPLMRRVLYRCSTCATLISKTPSDGAGNKHHYCNPTCFKNRPESCR